MRFSTVDAPAVQQLEANIPSSAFKDKVAAPSSSVEQTRLVGMPGLVRTRSSLEAEDAEITSGSSDGADQETPPSQNTNKRARLSNRNGDDVDDSWMLSPPRTVTTNRTRMRTPTARTNGMQSSSAQAATVLSHDPSTSRDEMKPGQLTKIHLRNFVTYTNATFYPGPSLNMIIGPNGTGKSSVVCAICIGLGYSTSNLGRAKELGEFVKHGAKDATIEITLKGMPGKTDPEIRLDFTREGDKKHWHLNGQLCRAKDISTLTSKFGIQIDNLCHFLPQDRVVEFSKTSPKERLKETLRAAAPVELTEQHARLKELTTERKTMYTEQAQKRHNLAGMKSKQNDQRQDVERMRERQEVLANVKRLEKLRPIAEHMKHRRVFEETKAKKEAMESQLAQLNEQVEPYDQACKQKQGYCDKMKKAVDLRKKLCDQFENQAKKCKTSQDKAESDMKALQQKRQSETKSFDKQKNHIQTIRGNISNVEAQMEQQPIEIDAAEYNRKINDKVRGMRELQQSMNDIRDGGRERQQRLDEKRAQIRHAQEEVDSLRSQSGQQRNKLGKLSQDTLRAWDWIEQNRHRLKSEVYGPPLISCTVKDRRYAAMMESLMKKGDYCRITCTNVDDWKMLQGVFSHELHISDVSLFNAKLRLRDWPSPLNGDQMRNVNLEGWALDFLEGPEDVLAMLCEEVKLHSTGIITREISDEQFRELENSGLSNWLTPKSSYRVTRRAEYGPQAKSTRVVPVPDNARQWSSQGVDVSMEMEMKQRIAQLQDELDNLDSTQGQTRSRLDEVQRSIKHLEDEREQIQTEKDDKQRHNAQLAALPARLNNLKSKLADFENIEAEYRASLEEIDKQREVLILKNGQLAIDYVNLVDTLRQKYSELLPAVIALIEAESDAEQLKKQHANATAERDRLKIEVDKIKIDMHDARKRAMDAFKHWQRLAEQDAEMKEYFQSLSDEERTRTPEELDADIDALGARLETLYDGDPNLVREFEARAAKIEKLEQEVETWSSQLQEVQSSIMSLRETWEPAVDALAGKVSGAFSDLLQRIGCAGEVTVYKAGAASSTNNDSEDGFEYEDGYNYEDWAIQILVKFRENEQLSVLDSHRQSGGERAVTTIYYLMALQKLSRAPFRVVDEINQGMDPKNERIVHERLVDMSCGTGEHDEDDDEDDDEDESRSQYFLITPKLLPGLKYTRGMKVHCIASGEFMPPTKKNNAPSLDFATLLAKKKTQAAPSMTGSRAVSVVNGLGA